MILDSGKRIPIYALDRSGQVSRVTCQLLSFELRLRITIAHLCCPDSSAEPPVLRQYSPWSRSVDLKHETVVTNTRWHVRYLERSGILVTENTWLGCIIINSVFRYKYIFENWKSKRWSADYIHYFRSYPPPKNGSNVHQIISDRRTDCIRVPSCPTLPSITRLYKWAQEQRWILE